MATPGLTVCLIVRDEHDNLASMLPEVIAATDDVVVVDTGSDDDSAELARSLGARVLSEPWTDDFASARNRGLREVRTSHVLWLDADDRVTRADLAVIRNEALAHPDAGIELILVNESDDPNAVTSCWQLRVVPAWTEHVFEGRVHEQLRPSLHRTGTPIVRLPVAIRHVGHRDPHEALRKAHRNLELLVTEAAERPEDAVVQYHVARTATHVGRLADARDAARRCLELRNDGEIAQAAAALLGRLELEAGHSDEAEKVLREAVDRRPDDGLARFLLGDLLRRRGDFEGALRELRTARVAPLRRTTLPVPAAGLARAVRLRLGEILEILERPAEAAVAYREILDDRPQDPTASPALARTLIAAGAWDEAERHLDRLMRTTEAEPEVTLLRAHLAFARGRTEEAADSFGKVLTLAPSNWAAPLHLGHLALRQGDADEAFDLYSKALELADEPEIRVGLAAVHLERGELRAALDDLETVFDRCPGRPLPRGTEALAGEALLRLGRADEARRAFEHHLERLGPDARIVARLADCYRELGGHDAARFGYEEALKLQPDLASARRGLAALPSGE